MVFSKVALSEAVYARPIAVAATATPGTLLHTVAAGALDLITLWACNNAASATTLTLEIGGSDTPITQTIPAKSGMYLVCDDAPLGAGQLTAFAALAGVLVTGHCTRIT